jgi:hypothetical protein
MIADLAGVQPNDISKISRQVLGDDYFKTRYKKGGKATSQGSLDV